MKLLVFGKTGQVAQELAALVPGARFLGRDEADLSRPEACARVIAMSDADAIINAAAYTAVDKAESEPSLADTINGHAPAAMARAAAARGAAFVHISSDYVFSGSGTAPWPPDAPPAPQSAYGRSKLLGEEGVAQAGGVHGIVRTSWVVSAHGRNFVKTMLALAGTHKRIRVVEDQIGAPTPARAVAQAVLTMARRLANSGGPSGVYHFAGAPNTSWAGFAREIFAQAGLSGQVTVEAIPGSAYPTPATRPCNSRLDCTSLMRDFGIPRPDWRAGLRDILADLKENNHET